MPNRFSKANHEPIRTCVICKSKNRQVEMLHFKIRNGKIVYDFFRSLSGRGHYICDAEKCIEGLPKWMKRKLKKKSKIR